MGSHLLLRSLTIFLLLASVACDPVSLGGNLGSGGASGGATASSGATTGGEGTGGGDAGPCGMDCTKLQTAPCTVAVCNTGQVAGPLDTCVVIPAPDGTACAPTDLCQVDAACTAGTCVGMPKDCTSSPLHECNGMACDPGTGTCTATPDSTKDGTPCVLTGDLCKVGKACLAGQCTGGAPKDCSALDIGCQVGACDGTNGNCAASTLPDGTACNDHDACTQGDACTAGACAGTPVASCKLYLDEGFETCPDGWTLSGDWQCGTPMNVGPAKAHGGNSCIATQIAGNYDNDQSFSACTADSPPIDLTQATNPQASFWAWVHTEGGAFDGWNMKVSTDGGQTFQEVMTVTPPYPLTITAEPSWGGDRSAEGWQNYTADLTAYAGHSIILRYAFRSDPATVYSGVYIDDVVVAEPVDIPLYVTTPCPLPDVFAGKGYSVQLSKVGGTSGSVWSIVGGTNDAWLVIDPATGKLSGTPAASDVGPVSVTVRVQEPTLPSNHAEWTCTFDVEPDVYYTSWEGQCPDGWTLTGDWTCGVPMNMNVGAPATCYSGTQCMGTGMSQDYGNDDTWAATTATSPPIDLSGMTSPTLTFRMWVDTEGFTFDGANLQISTDGGMTYTVLDTVTPAYSLMIGGEPAWGGHQAALGWQLVQADLAAYAGQTILLRFAFESDFTNAYPGVYIDDFLVE